MKKICMEEVPEDLSGSHFSSYEKTFFKVSAQIFVIILCDLIDLENFLRFQFIIIQDDNV